MKNEPHPVKTRSVEVKRYLHIFSYFAGICLFLCMFMFFVTASQIGFGVKDICMEAKSKYEGNCEETLIKYLDDEDNSFMKRNSAIWALGQLGDPRALPVIEKYYDEKKLEKKCNRRKHLCQYEMHKALKLLNGDLNISAFVWRNNTYFKENHTRK